MTVNTHIFFLGLILVSDDSNRYAHLFLIEGDILALIYLSVVE